MPRPVLLTRTLGRVRRAPSRPSSRSPALAVIVGADATTDAATPVAATKAKKPNVVTPGDFTGYGFDQCQAPSQATMDRWLQSSPFLAVGIYIDGDSRACRKQTYLNATWVSTQLAKGWRLLPITLGPQASCQPRFPRYKDDFRISPKRNASKVYATALQQGRTQATKSVAAAKALGIAPGSTLWYDLEGFDYNNTAVPRVGADVPQRVDPADPHARLRLRRLLQRRLRDPGSRQRPGQPAEGLHAARPDLDRPLGRPRQHQHVVHPQRRLEAARPGQAVPGRARRDLGRRDDQHRPQLPRRRPRLGRRPVRPTAAASAVPTYGYTRARPPTAATIPPAGSQVKVLQCLLKQQGLYTGRIHGRFDAQGPRPRPTPGSAAHGAKVQPAWTRRDWVTLFAAGTPRC